MPCAHAGSSRLRCATILLVRMKEFSPHADLRTASDRVRSALPDLWHSGPRPPAVLAGRADSRVRAPGDGGEADPDAGMKLLIWVGVMFVSILVHELGHSFVIRYFGQLPAHRAAHAGRAGHHGCGTEFGFRTAPLRRTPQQQILISLAGPGAGFVLAGADRRAADRHGWRVPLRLRQPAVLLPWAPVAHHADADCRSCLCLHAVLQHLLGTGEPAAGAAAGWRTSGQPTVAR